MVNALLILGLALIIGSFFLNTQSGMQKRAIRIEDLEHKRRRRR